MLSFLLTLKLVQFLGGRSHVIHDTRSYNEDIGSLCKLAKDFPYLYLIGIEPTSPITDYGYFRAEGSISHRITKVSEFVEKPDDEEVIKLLRTGDFYWNSGIFVARTSVFESMLEEYCAEEFNAYMNSDVAFDEEAYKNFGSISFDEAVLQNTDRVYAIIGSFDWIDIGNPTRLQGAISEDICSMNEKYFL